MKVGKGIKAKSHSNGRLLTDHLYGTGVLARSLAELWGGGDFVFGSGLYHDLGKFQLAVQHRLDGGGGKAVHSTTGALHLVRRLERDLGLKIKGIVDLPPTARAMIAAILGHHTCLPDRRRLEERLGFTTGGGHFPGLDEYKAAIAGEPPPDILNYRLPAGIMEDRHPLFARMLFSVLRDADILDSSGRKPHTHVPFTELKARFDVHMQGKSAGEGRLTKWRNAVLAACLSMAKFPKGFYALEAPTGFAKTLSALAFALEHAIEHGLDRIIYVAPFLTAVEQTTQVFRNALGLEKGDPTILEHYSTADRDLGKADGAKDDDTEENWKTDSDDPRDTWDARIIVTTTVQFLESLHAHDKRRCRKLHRMTGAVIIIDEGQSIPLSVYVPTVDTLNELVKSYRSTLLWTTATLPAFGYHRRVFPVGIKHITPILDASLLSEMRTIAAERVGIVVDRDEVSLAQIAARVADAERSTLCIVNTRAHAATLFQDVKKCAPDHNVFHLSAAMCPRHRRDLIEHIKHELKNGKLIKVISTQVVEAGIDIDFPQVFRAMAGLDSLIQSAGRCNREGGYAEGLFLVFELEEGVPFMFRQQVAITRNLLTDGGSILDPNIIRRYYEKLRNANAKGEEILEEQALWNFVTVGRKYRLIEPTISVIVPYGAEGEAAVARILQENAGSNSGKGMGKLLSGVSEFEVNVHAGQRDALLRSGALVEIGDTGSFVVVQKDGRPYDAEMGLPMTEPSMLT